MITMFTYFAYSPEMQLYKIGKSERPRQRVKSIKPRAILLAAVLESDLTERAAHGIFSDERVMGEWFDTSLEAIKSELEKRSIPIIQGPSLLAVGKPDQVRKSATISPEISLRISRVSKSTGVSPSVVTKALLEFALGSLEDGDLILDPVKARTPQDSDPTGLAAHACGHGRKGAA